MRQDKLLLFSIFLLSFTFIVIDCNNRRVRRHLIFNEGSRLFISVDVRDNLFIHSDFFAQSFGFKVVWNLPEKVSDLHGSRVQRRDVHNGLEHLLNQFTEDGHDCLKKFMREAQTDFGKDHHFLAQMYQILFSPPHDKITNTSDFTDSDLKPIKDNCPFSLLPSQAH